MNFVRLGGALLIFIAPLFNWASMKLKYGKSVEKDTANLFKLAGNDYLDKGVYIFFALMIMLCGLALVAWSLAEFVPAIGNLKSKCGNIPVDLIIIGVALLFALLAFFNGDLMETIRECKDYIKDVNGLSGHSNHGFGPIIFFLGAIASAVPTVLNMVNNKSNSNKGFYR